MKRKTLKATFYPLMLIHAQDTKHAGAARLHVLAHTIDHEGCNHLYGECKGGSGKIERARLEAEALALGVSRSTFYDWLADARKAKILNGEGEYLYYASREKLSVILFCNSIDKSQAIIPLKLLFKPGWKSIVWAAYLKANHHHKKKGCNNKMQPVYKGNMISAGTLKDLTGVPDRAQRRYKKYVRSKQNISITTIPGSWETANTLNQAAKDHKQNRHYFVFNDPQQKDPAGIKNYRRVLAYTSPARRTVDNRYAEIGARGRRKKIERAILKGLRLVTICNYSNGNYSVRPSQATAKAANSEAKRYTRRFYDRANLLETLQFRDWTETEAREVYVMRFRAGRVGVFDREFA